MTEGSTAMASHHSQKLSDERYMSFRFQYAGNVTNLRGMYRFKRHHLIGWRQGPMVGVQWMTSMLFGSFLNGYAFWLLLGLALLISEFFVPGVVAVFFGIGALIVGLLTLAGVIESLPVQLLWFALISLVALFGLRRHCTRWLKGMVGGQAQQDLDSAGLLDQRVTVLTDFVDGVGDVLLNGAKWDAEASEPLRAGDTAWVTGFSGIVLRVSSRPGSSQTQ